jgi:O-antigen/teichoic acid export membrane protein
MSEIVNQSLQKIAKGTGIIFIGTIIWMLLGFIGRIILVRYITQTEYGTYCLALVIISIFATISTLGLDEGSTRYIAYFRGKKEGGKVKGIITSSIKIAIIASISLAIISFFSSDFISTSIFHTSALSTPLKIFSIAIPFTVLINVFIAIFRGFDRVDARLYFNNILRPVLHLLFLIAVIQFGLSFIGVVYAYVLSIAVTCIALVIYMMKKSPLSMRSDSSVTNPMTKGLLFFSVPLLAVAMLSMVMSWTDTLMLGYFKTPDVVGLYNVALPLASLISIVITSVAFLYTPIVSSLYGKNQMEEMKRTYVILTKWCFLATLPIFFVLFLFPGVVLTLLFGSRYIGASVALQILSLGLFVGTTTGHNYNILIAMGKTNSLMHIFLISGVTNIILNVALIPSLGIIGAAIASAFAVAMANIIISIKLYQFSGIHPLTRNYLKPVIISIGVIFISYIIAKSFLMVTFWMLIVLFILFLLVYALLLFLTKSFDNEDIMILLEIERRSGMNLTLIKKILKRFM